MAIDAAGEFRIGGDLPVVRLGFGAMRTCGPGVWGYPADREGQRTLLRRVVDRGVTLIDTADAYGPEISEYLLHEALHPYPQGVVIATKGGLVRGGPNDWSRDGRPEHLRVALANSLRRLGLDTIDLYQLHAPDTQVPLADQVGALARAREAGLIRHVGLSNVTVAQLQEARQIVPIATVQNRFNLGDREHAPVLDACTAHGIGFIPWYPLASGRLAALGGPLDRVVEKHGATPAQIALAWLLARSPVILPIPGTSSIAHFDENCGAADVQLDSDDMAMLAEP